MNGPEDFPEWDAVDWRACEEEVRRLRQTIFKATREQDWRKVRSLQRLLLRSRSNTLISVRRVTQHNAGRGTAGVDGQVALTSDARAEVAVEVRPVPPSFVPLAVALAEGHAGSWSDV
ncbi:reverse transcriptase N-terminal domain-containing protein [Nonomuraea sp. NPDC049695]|uniref:reverse transcriptase N-terminal domain-containing protein n=1 Tax=Nonomuraea sp. NPDC049695 TaxID=3154734 RepID=UPI00343F60BC